MFSAFCEKMFFETEAPIFKVVFGVFQEALDTFYQLVMGMDVPNLYPQIFEMFRAFQRLSMWNLKKETLADFFNCKQVKFP